jgi:peroxiredoxin
LADFQSLSDDYANEEIKIIAGSVDSLDKTNAFVEKLGITYPVAYGMDAKAFSDLTGAFYEKEKGFLHAAGFIIRPDKTIEVAVYSTAMVGRFVAQDVLNVIKYYKSLKKQDA